MRKKAAAALVAGAMTFVTSSPAEAVPGPGIEVVVGLPQLALSEPAFGLTCGLVSVTDQPLNYYTQEGVVFGGPLVNVSSSLGATIDMTCAVQVGYHNDTHRGDDQCSLRSGDWTLTVAVMGQCSYYKPEGQPVYVCTEIEINGEPRYFDADRMNPTEANWSSSPDVPCSEAMTQEIFPGPLEPVLDLITDDAVVIVALPDGSEPLHTNVGNSDCSNYSWNVGDYSVTCTTTPARACSLVAAVAVGTPGLSGTSSCGTLSATATVPAVPVAVATDASTTPWGCRLQGGAGIVVCVS